MGEGQATNFVFITGGVVSSLGKGVSAAAIASLLQAHGYKVRTRKLDPYLNIDPGTMSPYEHGEVFVTEDGAETDLDLGHYERFTDVLATKNDNITTGQIYKNLLEEERKGVGKLLGRTMQIVPHVTDAIKEFVMAELSNEDFVLCEIGGTVGDIESLPFLEAIRQIGNDLGRARVFYIHMTLLPYMRAAGELKTKPTQHSVKELLSVGIQPDMLICRAESAVEDKARLKISRFCNVAAESVVAAPDLESCYEIPVCYTKAHVDRLLLKHFRLPSKTKAPDARWQKILHATKSKTERVVIAIVGKYTGYGDAYLSLVEALRHGGLGNNTEVDIAWLESEKLEAPTFPEKFFENVGGILIPGGFGERGSQGKIDAVRFARTRKIPFLGICFGMQMAVIEYARNMLGLEGAISTEFSRKSNSNAETVVCMQHESFFEEASKEKGGTMRLGAYPCTIKNKTLAYSIYQCSEISERHRHRYEINWQYLERFEKKGMLFSGTSHIGIKAKATNGSAEKNDTEEAENGLKNGLFGNQNFSLPTCRSHGSNHLILPEIVELSQEQHPWFLGVQFHPELKSRPFAPHPIFRHFVEAASKHGKLV